MAVPLALISKRTNWTLEEINDEAFIITIPAVAFTGILMLVGVVGNALVLYIFSLKFKSSNHRCFVLSMAFFDLICCLICMPCLIVEMVFPYMFFNVPACKLLRSLTHYVTFGSIFILLLIAIERYRKICRPHGTQMPVTQAKKWILFIALGASVLMTVPAGILYGYRSVNIAPSITGVQCYYSDTVKDTIYPMLYNITLFITIGLAAVLMTACYAFVGRQIWNQRKFNYNKEQSSTTNFCRATPLDDVYNSPSDCKVSCQLLSNQSKETVTNKAENDDYSYSNHRSNYSNACRASTDTCQSHGSKSRHILDSKRKFARTHGNRLRQSIKITKILFAITLTFLLSYMPHLILMIVTITNVGFRQGMSLTQARFYQILLRSYLVNNMANPIIYGFMDTQFRTECKKLCRSADV